MTLQSRRRRRRRAALLRALSGQPRAGQAAAGEHALGTLTSTFPYMVTTLIVERGNSGEIPQKQGRLSYCDTANCIEICLIYLLNSDEALKTRSKKIHKL